MQLKCSECHNRTSCNEETKQEGRKTRFSINGAELFIEQPYTQREIQLDANKNISLYGCDVT